MKNDKNVIKLLRISLLLLGIGIIFSFGINTSNAANTSIYVNMNGNDSYDGSSSTWTGGLHGPKATIKNATGSLTSNGTINIARGTYNESNIIITHDMTLIGQNQENTIINGKQSGNSIFTINPQITVQISYLTFTNNLAPLGGAIYNNGYLTLNNTTFVNNAASWGYGGAIYNRVGCNLMVDNSIFENNKVNNVDGGAICNEGFLEVYNSVFIGNKAREYGGAISNMFDDSSLYVVNTDFINNSAIYGGAIYLYKGFGLFTTDSFKGNSASKGYGTIMYDEHAYLQVGNSLIIVKPGGNDFYSNQRKIYLHDNQWEITTVELPTIPTTIKTLPKKGITGDIVNITATLINTKNNTPIKGKNIQFKVNGNIIGTATTDETGKATINYKITQNSGTYTIINQFLGDKNYSPSSNKNILTVISKITASVNLVDGLYNTTKIVKLRMNEPGTIYYTLNGTTPTTKSKKYTNQITIKSTTTLKYLAVDLAGNKSPIYTNKYTIDKTAPKVITTNPKNNFRDVSLTTSITIKFNEKINKSIYFSKIYIKNLSTGKITHTTTKLSGNTITIKMIHSRLSLNNYQVYIPTKAVRDTVGNHNKRYVINFKTSRY